jgi:hypothetical protein
MKVTIGFAETLKLQKIKVTVPSNGHHQVELRKRRVLTQFHAGKILFLPRGFSEFSSLVVCLFSLYTRQESQIFLCFPSHHLVKWISNDFSYLNGRKSEAIKPDPHGEVKRELKGRNKFLSPKSLNL